MCFFEACLAIMDDVQSSSEMVGLNPSNPSEGEIVPAQEQDVESMVLPPPVDTFGIALPNAKAIVEQQVDIPQEEKPSVEDQENLITDGEQGSEVCVAKPNDHESSELPLVATSCASESTMEQHGQDEVESATNEQELKYWNAVKENPQDFTSWTYLLQFVEQENKLESARKAFDAFLNRYPYCYGYWKKFADMEKKNGNMAQASEVFEQGVEAVSLSVDLWVHYLNFTSQSMKGQPDSPTVMRSLFERAISAAGEDFRSDKLWDAYIEWEKCQRQFQSVTALYDRVLTVPTQYCAKHWTKFQEHVNSSALCEVLSAEELLKLKAETGAAPPGFSFDSDAEMTAPPGSEDEATVTTLSGEESASNTASELQTEDPEVSAVRAKVIGLRKVLHDANELEVKKRWVFEEAIKRPYFHVKPLERTQLKNWRDYLDFEISTGNHRRVVILFERCVIACALYEDFWQRFASYMEVHDCVDGCQHVYQRACDVHLPTKPHIHLAWAAFEEKHGNVGKAREILAKLDNAVPGLASVKLRRANLERRCKEFFSASSIYETAINENSDSELISFYSIKYARFLSKIVKDCDKSREVLKAALEKDKENKRLYLQLLDMELSVTDVDEDRVEEVFDLVKTSTLSDDVKEGFSQRRLEFLEDFSNSIVKITKAQEAHSKLYKSTTTTLTTGKKRSSEDGLDANAKVARTTESIVSTDIVQPAAASSYATTADYSNAYAAASVAVAAPTYNYGTQQWLGAYQTGHTGYNYPNWYQQYGQT